MSEPLRTCHHTYETGGACNSAAARDHKYCAFHLRQRARLMRMAQARARAERFDFRLPAIESMPTVIAAINQLVEAVAADMIDLKRAEFLLKALRFASNTLKNSDKWPASPFHSDQSAEVDLAAEYGLPPDLDLDTPPEVAFPPETSHSVILSEGDAGGCPIPPSVGGVGLSSQVADTASAQDFRPDSPFSAEWLELRDIENTQGADARAARFRQLERNRARRQLRGTRNRYADLALRLNIRQAAERLADRRLAERLAEGSIASVNPATKDFETEVAEDKKKMVAFDHQVDEYLAGKQVEIA
jgi:hypothetical protein